MTEPPRSRSYTRGGLNSGDLSSEEGTGKSLTNVQMMEPPRSRSYTRGGLNSGDLSSEEGTGKSFTNVQMTEPPKSRETMSSEEGTGKDLTNVRPFRVLGIQQIAIGAASKSALSALWVDLLGLQKTGTFRSERENVDEDILSVGAGAAIVEIDIMEPVDPSKSPRVAEPALNHIGLWIDNLPAAVVWLTARGVRFTPGGIRPGASGFDVCFIHPKGNAESPRCGEGVLIELVAAPPALVDAMDKLAAV